MTSSEPTTVRIIWFSILMSMFIYGVIAVLAIQDPVDTPFTDLVTRPQVLALYGVALTGLIAASVVPKMIASGSAGRGGAAKQSLIVEWALIETAAIAGLIAAFLSRCPTMIVPPLAAAVVCQLFAYPTAERLQSAPRHDME